MRWRAALGREVVDTSSAKKVGTVAGLVLDPEASEIVAMVVGSEVIGWKDAGGIGEDAVTISSADMLRGPSSELESAGVSGVADPISKPMLTEDGHELGTVSDVEFDETTGKIRRLVLDDDRIKGSRLIGVGSYAVMVSSTDRASETGDLEHLTKDELYEMARSRDLEGRSSMDKAALISALS